VGTRIDVAGLFAALPARLKFLKSVRSENEAASEIVRRLAAARPTIDFRLSLDGRSVRFPAQEDSAEGRLRRLGDVLGADFVARAFAAPPVAAQQQSAPRWSPPRGGYTPRPAAYGTLALQTPGFGEDDQAGFAIEPSADARADAAASPELLHKPLGAAKAQVHDTYILAQTLDGVVLVDMHAAHERLVLERIKRARADGPVPSQALLVPEVVELGPAETERVLASSEALAQLGLVIEGFGPGAVLVREMPAALGTCDAHALLRDVADGLAEWGAALPLSERLDRLAGTFACHHSIRAGRRLKPEEMNALLRQIEAEPAAAQCNHGRPTYVTLSRTDLERLFHRR
jgi:DNA mismatch repair protein MutL